MARHCCTGWSALAWALLGCGSPEEPPQPATGVELLRPVPGVMTPGHALPDVVAVRLIDASGAGRAGVPLTWTVEEGGGRLFETRTETGLDGIATTRWAVGALPGRQRITVAVPGEQGLSVTTDARAFRATMMDAGYGYVCGVVAVELWCAGGSIQWAAGPPYSGSNPRHMLPGLQVKGVAAGDTNICALELTGQPVCFPVGYFEPSGQPPIGRPPVPPLRAISSGDTYFCGIAAADGTPWCWGMRYGSAEAEGVHQVSSTLRLTTISAGGGDRFACGLDDSSAAWCWRAPADNEPAEPRRVAGAEFRTFSAGGTSACGATRERTLVCLNSTDLIPQRLPGYRAETVACGAFWCISARGTEVDFVWAGQSGVAAPTQVGFQVTAISADDAFCVQGVGGDIYCDPGTADYPDVPLPGHRFFAMPAREAEVP